MTAAVVALAVALVGAMSAIGWLVYRSLAAADQLAAMDDERDKAAIEAERLAFELDATKKRLADAERTIDALGKEPRAKPNADLDARDVTERVRRAAEQARAAAGSAVPARADRAEVHPPDAAGGSQAAEVQPAGPLDPNEVLR